MASGSKLSPAEVEAIIAKLLVEKDRLQKAGDRGGAEAIDLAIAYWREVLAHTDAERS